MSYYDAEAAERVIAFCEEYGVHSKGIFAGQKLKLLAFQREEIIKPLFGTLNDSAYRQYREAYLSIAAKNGKSFITSALALYMLMGDGEAGAEVYIAACDKQQAGICFSNAAHFVRSNPELNRVCKIVDSSKRIIYKDRVLRVLSSDADSAMGYNASAVICDELAFWKSRELYDALRSRMQFRKQPLFISITTACKNLFGVAHELYDDARNIKAGISHDPTFFSYIRECPADADIGDPVFDVVFSNAALQWVGEHATVFPLLMRRVAVGGALAVQMPADVNASAHRIMREHFIGGGVSEWFVHEPPFYYDLLARHARRIQVWTTEYLHVLPSVEAIVEWYRSTGLRPFLEALADDGQRERFLHDYVAGLRHEFQPRTDGHILFPFRRLFIIAEK